MDIIIYSVCFGVGLLFALVSVFFGHVFGGHDVEAHVEMGAGGHVEAGFQDSGMPGLSPLSPTAITVFVTAFGAFGLIFSHIGPTSSVWISAPLSLLGAFGVAGAVLTLFSAVFQQTQGSSESRVAALVGVSATIITPIPENGVGEIAYVQAGTRYSAPAREERGTAVPGGQTVKIVRVVGSQFFVVPV
jgi:membrane-bound ClpP family serine protease